jgi:hypothetical protein
MTCHFYAQPVVVKARSSVQSKPINMSTDFPLRNMRVSPSATKDKRSYVLQPRARLRVGAQGALRGSWEPAKGSKEPLGAPPN